MAAKQQEADEKFEKAQSKLVSKMEKLLADLAIEKDVRPSSGVTTKVSAQRWFSALPNIPPKKHSLTLYAQWVPVLEGRN